MTATPEQLNERRLKAAFKRYQEARERLNAHVEEHASAFEDAYDLSDAVNTSRKRLEAVVRETKMGIGPITVTVAATPEFDVDYVEKLLNGKAILDDLIKVSRKVQRKVFDSLVQDGTITAAQAKKAIVEVKESVRVSGLPTEISLP
jgi:hypothetical protein